MFQIRIHGRGGQGVVTAAEILSVAAFLDGRFAQAFPSFGSERMGAPVMSFCRIDDRKIRLREPVMQADALIVQDATLLHHVDLFSGLNPETGYLMLNASRNPAALGIDDFVSCFPAGHFCSLPATGIALKHIGRPLPNIALVGAFAAISDQITLKSVEEAVRQRFTGTIAEKNSAAAKEAYLYVRQHQQEAGGGMTHAAAN